MATNNSTNNWSPLTTKGDLFTYDTAPNRLSIGSNYYYPMADSSASVGLSYQLPVLQYQTASQSFNDFYGSNNGDLVVTAASSGTGASASILTGTLIDNGHLGIYKLDMGTTTTGSATVSSNGGSLTWSLGGSTITIETCINLSALSNGTDTYSFTFGTANSTVVASITNGVYVSYSSTTNSGNFVLTANKNNVTTVTNTSTTWTGASSWYKLRLVITGTSSATLYGAASGSDFTSLGTVSSNLPTVILCPFFINLLKSAGTTDTFAYVDYVTTKIAYTSLR